MHVVSWQCGATPRRPTRFYFSWQINGMFNTRLVEEPVDQFNGEIELLAEVG